MQYPFYVNLPGAAPVEPRTWERSLVNFKHISLIPCRCHMQYLDQLGKRNSNTIRLSAMLDIMAFQFFIWKCTHIPVRTFLRTLCWILNRFKFRKNCSAVVWANWVETWGSVITQYKCFVCLNYLLMLKILTATVYQWYHYQWGVSKNS